MSDLTQFWSVGEMSKGPGRLNLGSAQSVICAAMALNDEVASSRVDTMSSTKVAVPTVFFRFNGFHPAASDRVVLNRIRYV